MKHELTADYYFDLSSYAHAEIFHDHSYVWEALGHLKDYLKKLPHGVIEGEVSPQAFLVDAHLIFIGKGSIVEPGAYIKGPCYIGQNCTIRHGAYIRGDLLAGDHCVIGHDTEVKKAILLDHVKAGHFAYLGDSILGNHVNLGAGTKCANLKLDEQEVVVRCADEVVKTGLRKLGAVLGDGVQTGCNTVTSPGALVGREVWSYPNTSFGGFVSSYSTIRSEAALSIKTRR